ncbi:MAG: class I SAM-dependent methyltransferase [Vicinamibacterales bacterium]
MSWPLRLVGAVHGRMVHQRRAEVLAENFAEIVPRGNTVLDVGCGDGHIARLLHDRRPDLRVCGVDPLRREHTQVEVLPFDGSRLPFADRSWDTVLLCDVLHHADRPVNLMLEAARVAKHTIVIKDHSVEGPLARITLKAMDVVGNGPHGVALPFNYMTPAEWRDAYRATGLEIREIRRELKLYPPWLDLFLGRSLHFVARFEIRRDARF